jgi:hypothetical protein
LLSSHGVPRHNPLPRYTTSVTSILESDHSFSGFFGSFATSSSGPTRNPGGKGWDVGSVRQRLGYENLKSIERYIGTVRNEELVSQEFAGQAAAGGK